MRHFLDYIPTVKWRALVEEYTKQIIPNDLPLIFLCVVWTVCGSFSRAFLSVNATETCADFLTRLHSGENIQFMSCLCLNFACIFSWVSSFSLVAECPSISKELPCCTQQGAWQQASGHARACVSLQVEGENDEQPSTDQASAVKTKNVFIAQNVASLQELGRSSSTVRKLIYMLTQTSCLCFFHVEKNQASDRSPLDSVSFC